MRTRRPLIALVVMTTFALASCGGSSSDGASDSTAPPETTAAPAETTAAPAESTTTEAGGEAPAGDGAVTIKGFAYDPDPIEVKVGDTVTWSNEDSADHTATSGADSPETFDTGDIANGATGEVTFETAGTYDYICSIHDNMNGTVEVTE